MKLIHRERERETPWKWTPQQMMTALCYGGSPATSSCEGSAQKNGPAPQVVTNGLTHPPSGRSCRNVGLCVPRLMCQALLVSACVSIHLTRVHSIPLAVPAILLGRILRHRLAIGESMQQRGVRIITSNICSGRQIEPNYWTVHTVGSRWHSCNSI